MIRDGDPCPTCLPVPNQLLLLKEEREAVLSFGGCTTATFWMIGFIKGLLDGISTNATFSGKSLLITFASYCPGNNNCGTSKEGREAPKKSRGPGNREMDVRPNFFLPLVLKAFRLVHDVLRVKLRSGEEFAVDLAGAQFGHHELAIQWNEYEKERILDVTEVKKVSDSQGLLQVKDYSDLYIQIRYLEWKKLSKVDGMVLYAVLELLNLDMLIWQKNSMSLAKMRSLPEAKSQQKQKELVDYAHWRFSGKRAMTSPPLGKNTFRGRELSKQVPGDKWPFNKE